MPRLAVAHRTAVGQGTELVGVPVTHGLKVGSAKWGGLVNGRNYCFCITHNSNVSLIRRNHNLEQCFLFYSVTRFVFISVLVAFQILDICVVSFCPASNKTESG